MALVKILLVLNIATLVLVAWCLAKVWCLGQAVGRVHTLAYVAMDLTRTLYEKYILDEKSMKVVRNAMMTAVDEDGDIVDPTTAED
jgi:hypothetical protein